MAITFHPKVGQILLCDFSTGFKEPEMVKSGRPVLVVAPSASGRGKLVTVVALSTTAPDPVQAYHYQIPRNSMPQRGRFQDAVTWVKADMIYTVGFERLDLIKTGKCPRTGKREYFLNRLGRDQMKMIYACILSGLGLQALSEHL